MWPSLYGKWPKRDVWKLVTWEECQKGVAIETRKPFLEMDGIEAPRVISPCMYVSKFYRKVKKKHVLQ